MFAHKINHLLQKQQKEFAQVVDYQPEREKIIPLDFSANNPLLTPEIVNDTESFTQFIEQTLAIQNAKFGFGGYLEHRNVYARSGHFDTTEGEPRRLHLGVDIWGKVNTPVYAFMDAKVHSFAFNNHFGDYGATIILEHQLANQTFYSLYGHLSLQNIAHLQEGQTILKGKAFCDFGKAEENGFWPPHLHFQLMCDMEGKKGDYPGVGKLSELELWKQKIPNPNLVLNWI